MSHLTTNDVEKSQKQGAWRNSSKFRQAVTADGSSGFKAEKNRYHLYVSYACPWAHRTLLVRKLKGLEDAISFSSVDYFMGSKGWTFGNEESTKDPIEGKKAIRELYFAMDPDYTGRFTVPVLYDTHTHKIVNNESSEIIRMLNSEFDAFAKNPSLDLYPESFRSRIDEVNSWVYPYVNDGVYRCGFSSSQEDYDSAFEKLFNHLEKLEALLDKQRYLAGDQLTEADIRLWTTLIRFDAVYYVHFKCNGKLIAQYPNLLDFAREIYQMEGISETVNWKHIKHHYYTSHESINPHRIVAQGPIGQGDIFWKIPHSRDEKFPLSLH